VAAIEVKPHVEKNRVAVELTDFSVFYSQDSIANAEAAIKNKGSRIVVERGQIVKVHTCLDPPLLLADNAHSVIVVFAR
jgi:hypothetical protein